jgi:hypothetical protein
MHELRVNQHIEADSDPFFFAADDRAADIVIDAKDFEEEIAGHRDLWRDFQLGAAK